MSTAAMSTGENIKNAVPATSAQQKRARIQLSCTSCRHAKLKCDRSQPCSQCVKRNRSSFCIYATVPVRQRPPKGMQGRLNHLESLVIGMMNDTPSGNGFSPPSSAPFNSSRPSVTQEIQPAYGQGPIGHSAAGLVEPIDEQSPTRAENPSGRVVLGTNETSYVGATHWAAILEDIEEVKGYFNETPDDDYNPSNEGQTAAMALGNASPASRADILAALPERSVVDRLVSRYFNSNDPAMIILHKPTFQKEEFWADPSSTPVMWIALLYAILCLSTFYSLRAADELVDHSEGGANNSNKYRNLCSQSLVLANYFKPGPYTMEALLLYFESEFAQPGDSAAKCWVLHALAVRLALRMGYHRDATNHVNISAFYGEMRRRAWHLLSQVDLILSFQVGLPSMVRAVQSDTTPPNNLFDSDFSQNSVELPPARPESENTPVSYMICKARICHAFGSIVDQAHSIMPVTYSEVLNLDVSLHESYDLIPPFLLIRPLDQAITDDPNLIMQRFNITLLFHKSRCVLHRKYLQKKGLGDQYSYSRRSCVDSALELLHYQSVINDAIKSGGPLSRDRWFLSTIAAHDFLLGAMIIYLVLMSSHEADVIAHQSSNRAYPEVNRESQWYHQLELSYEIWKSSPREARDAKKATRVLGIMLRNAMRHHGSLDPLGSTVYAIDALQYSDNAARLEQNQTGPVPPGHMEDIGTMINMPDTLEWETWDNHINAPDFENSEQFWTSDTNLNEFTLTDNIVAIERIFE